MAKQFTSAEWRIIRSKLDADPERSGLPQREYGSVLMESFNIRKKAGIVRSRINHTWELLPHVCRSFDPLATK